MKPPFSLKIRKPLSKSILAATLALMALSGSAQAVVTISFSQNGSDVIGVLGGTLILPALGNRVLNDVPFPPNLNGGSAILMGLTGAPTDYFIGGNTAFTSLSMAPSSFSGPGSFGFQGVELYISTAADPGSTITPTGTFTWSGQTLAGIGLGSLPMTPQVAYTAASGDTVVYVNAVPEPSSILSAVSGLGVLLLRRRR